ncbi:MAG: DUF3306 domain-containing protein [Xanthobacteraceae bacterium]
MTEPDNFILRWARLKRDSDSRHKTDFSGSLPPDSVETVSTGAEGTAAQPRTEAAADGSFGLASLPSIEAITADTDIRGFLQSRVPAELTRAALRQAWANDPAIRDFIGIAENQWDFNDPNAIPGFGPLQAADNAPAVLAQALGRRDQLAEMIPEMPVPVEQSLSAATIEPADLDRSVQQTFDGSPSTNDIRSLPEDGSGEGAAINSDGIAKRVDPPRNHRSHGSALPRWDL